jgi:hypothetical protein
MVTTQEEIQKLFTADVAKKLPVLTWQQAEIVALRSILAGVKAGRIEEAAGREFVISNEIQNGRTREDADEHVTTLLDGRHSAWADRTIARRIFGIEAKAD